MAPIHQNGVTPVRTKILILALAALVLGGCGRATMKAVYDERTGRQAYLGGKPLHVVHDNGTGLTPTQGAMFLGDRPVTAGQGQPPVQAALGAAASAARAFTPAPRIINNVQQRQDSVNINPQQTNVGVVATGGTAKTCVGVCP